jgi:hypothetical protein
MSHHALWMQFASGEMLEKDKRKALFHRCGMLEELLSVPRGA